ncbi:MAG: HNH endonuclease signature motif containing protein [Pseudomonadota bacterium]|nr:HNH endonuclease signature motif containing protein [Pseudomonadota bacterium]
MTMPASCWNTSTDTIVRQLWGTMPAAEIASKVNEVLEALRAPPGTQDLTAEHGAGVVWRAQKLGLINEEQREVALRAAKRASKHPIPAALRAATLRDQPTCRICDAESPQVHRVTPFLAGGTEDLTNLWALCASCAGRARRWPNCLRPFTLAVPLVGTVMYASVHGEDIRVLGPCSHGKHLLVGRAKHRHFWVVFHGSAVDGGVKVEADGVTMFVERTDPPCGACAEGYIAAPFLPEDF